jgi:mannose-6-phosphate isomerase-like protein (cupin superfamily)
MASILHSLPPDGANGQACLNCGVAAEILDFRPGANMAWEITETDSAFVTVNRIAAGWSWVGAPVHLHPTATETYEVREGDIQVLLRDTWRDVSPGETVSIPPGTAHTLRGSGERDVVLVNSHTPALQFERFFREFHRLVSTAEVKLPPKSPRSMALLAMLFSAYPEEQGVVKPPPFVFNAAAFVGRRFGLTIKS